MSQLNRFRWISCLMGIVFAVIFLVGAIMQNPALEALSIVVLFADVFLICIKNRCPDCRRSLPLHPPILQEEEFCRSCGSKIE